MFNNFGINISSIFKTAEEERISLRHPYVGTEHLLLAILKSEDELSNYLKKYNLTYTRFRKELLNVVGSSNKDFEINLWTPLLKRVVANALENAKERSSGIVQTKDLLISLLEEGEGIAIRLLIGMDIDLDELYEDISKNNKLNNKPLSVLEIGTLLNGNISLDEVILGRDREIDLIIETLLRKKKNNPILIGDAGVGKTAIIEELTRRIEKKMVPDRLIDAKIVSLEMGSLVSGTKYRGEFEEKLTKIIKELEDNDNIILFIDEIHSMVKAGGAEGAITAGDIFKPALARGSIKCIGATTKDEYLKYFEPDKALMRRFEVINVTEPTVDETRKILLKVKSEYEKHHQVIINNEIIDEIIYYSDKFIYNKKNPDKAIDFLDSVCSKVKTKSLNNKSKKSLFNELSRLKKAKESYIKNNNYEEALNIYHKEISIKEKINKNNNVKEIVKEEDILDVLESKTNIIFNKERIKLLDNIDGNDEIINTIKNKLYNHECFLKIYIDNNKKNIIEDIIKIFPRANYIKIDLKEYSSASDINKLIGTPQGYIGYMTVMFLAL